MPTMLDLERMIDEEIASVKRKAKPFGCQLTRVGDIYKGYTKYPVEGQYSLTFGTKSAVVDVAWNEDHIEIDADVLGTEEDLITAQLTKDETAILAEIKESVKNPLHENKGFIIGPPGTGKTKVIKKIVENALQSGAKRIAVLSPTNMAVENVFESLDLKALGLKEGDAVLNIKTDKPSLQALHPQRLHSSKLEPIRDAIDLLQEAKMAAYRKKRDLSASIAFHNSSSEAISIKQANASRDLQSIREEIRTLEQEAEMLQKRKDHLEGNDVLKKLTGVVLGHKADRIREQLEKNGEEQARRRPVADRLSSELVEYETIRTTSSEALNKLVQERSENEEEINQIESELQKYKKQIDSLSNSGVFKDARLVGATLVGAAINKRMQEVEFDMIIVDEASMASLPLITAACRNISERKLDIRFKPCKEFNAAQNAALNMAMGKKIVFVGDPMQLSPIANTFDMRKSIFSYFSIEQIFHGVNIPNAVFLDTNYRCHPDIVELTSRLFYGGLLKAGKESSGSSLFVRRSRAKMQRDGSSYINAANADIAISQVKRALERGRRSIGVITPFRRQAEWITEELKELTGPYPDADLQAGTVHKFQGKERDIIIFDLTFSPASSNALIPTYDGDRDSEVGKMLNVAMTRAKDFFVVIGDIDGLTSLKKETLIVKDWLNGILNIQTKRD